MRTALRTGLVRTSFKPGTPFFKQLAIKPRKQVGLGRWVAGDFFKALHGSRAVRPLQQPCAGVLARLHGPPAPAATAAGRLPQAGHVAAAYGPSSALPASSPCAFACGSHLIDSSRGDIFCAWEAGWFPKACTSRLWSRPPALQCNTFTTRWCCRQQRLPGNANNSQGAAENSGFVRLRPPVAEKAPGVPFVHGQQAVQAQRHYGGCTESFFSRARVNQFDLDAYRGRPAMQGNECGSFGFCVLTRMYHQRGQWWQRHLACGLQRQHAALKRCCHAAPCTVQPVAPLQQRTIRRVPSLRRYAASHRAPRQLGQLLRWGRRME